MPPICKPNNPLGYASLIGILAFSALPCWLVYYRFMQKYWQELSKDEQKHPLNVTAVVIILSIPVERSLRIGDAYLRFYEPTSVTLVYYQVISLLVPLWCFCVMFNQAYRLNAAFEDSALALPKKEFRSIITLITVCLVSVFIGVVLSGFSEIEDNPRGQIALISIYLICLISASMVFVWIDWAFGSRLRRLIVASAVSSRSSAPPLSPNSPSSPNDPKLKSISSASSNQNCDAMKSDRESVASVAQRIRKATLSDIDASQRGFLSISAKGTVIGISLSIGTASLFGAVVLYGLFDCVQIGLLMGHVLFMFQCWIFSVCMFLSLRCSHDEYSEYCRFCHRWILKVTTFLTQESIQSTQKIRDSAVSE